MYKLPNNIKIDDGGLFDAFLDGDVNHIYYLDVLKGDIGCIDKGAKKESTNLDSNRYFKIPKISTEQRCKYLLDFAHIMVSSEDKKLAEKLSKIEISLTGSNNAIKILEDNKDGWIHGWTQWKHDSSFDVVDKWMSSLPVKIVDDWEFDCDCELCKLM